MPSQSSQHYIISSNCTCTHKQLVWAIRNYNGSLAGGAEDAIFYTFSCHYAGYHESIKVTSYILLFKVFAGLIWLTSMLCPANTININALPLSVIGDGLSEHRINVKLLVQLEIKTTLIFTKYYIKLYIEWIIDRRQPLLWVK